MRRLTATLATLITTMMLTGCWGVWGVEKTAPSTSEFRIETEVVPNAELVRESTLPVSQAGRYAFRRGADRLLVLTRITSFRRRLPEDKPTAAPTGERYDANLERAWITLPLGAAVGEKIRMEELDRKFLTGFDVNRENDGDYYIRPNRIDGFVTVVEERSDALVIDINVEVQPSQLTPWSVREVMTVPLAPEGRRAVMVREGAAVDERVRRRATPTAPTLSEDTTEPAPATPATTPTPQPTW